MNPILALSKKLETCLKEQKRLIKESVQAHEAELGDMNAEQLNQGIDSDGQTITPGYASLTKSIKRFKGQPSDRVTLKDEGDYHRGLRPKVGLTSFEMISTDWKSEMLREKYGEEIEGLTEQSKIEFSNQFLLDDLRTKNRKILGI